MKINVEKHAKKILITGGAGFIGYHLTEHLLKRYNVIVMDNLSTGTFDNIKDFLCLPNFKFFYGDITNYNDCKKCCNGVDFVIHLAAMTSVPKSIKYPYIYNEINVKGTFNIMLASCESKVKRLIFSSSSSVYGDNSSPLKIEGEEGNVISPYAMTKKINEQYGKLFSDIYNLETVGLRYFNVFGERQRISGKYTAVIPKFIDDILKNKKSIIYGSGEQYRDFTYVKNIVSACEMAINYEGEFKGEIFNIGLGVGTTINSINKYIREKMDSAVKPEYEDCRKGDVFASVADLHKSNKVLNYTPTFELYDSIDRTILWYKNNNLKLEDVYEN